MRYVNFIKSLNIERLPLAGDTMKYRTANFTRVDDNGEAAFLYTSEAIQEEIVPVNMISRINNGVRTDTFIAYTKEVEELIEVPFMAVKEELYQAQTYKRKIETATWINRLVYLFTGNLR